MTHWFAQEFPRPLLRMRHRRSQHGVHRRRLGGGGQDSVRGQLFLLPAEQGLRAVARYGGLPRLQRESGGNAQRHFDRRGRPFADEHRGNQSGLFAARVHGAVAGRRSGHESAGSSRRGARRPRIRPRRTPQGSGGLHGGTEVRNRQGHRVDRGHRRDPHGQRSAGGRSHSRRGDSGRREASRPASSTCTP